jgi:hypothetical protein
VHRALAAQPLEQRVRRTVRPLLALTDERLFQRDRLCGHVDLDLVLGNADRSRLLRRSSSPPPLA